MVWVLAFDRLTVKAKAVGLWGLLFVVLSCWATSLMYFACWVSAFCMVPTLSLHDALPILAPDRVTVKVSSGSNAVSAHTSTVTGLLVSPGAKEDHTFERQIPDELLCWLLAQLEFPIAVTLPVA